MERYIYEAGERTPFVHFDPGGELVISGRSFPKDASIFFDPLLRWMEDYKRAPALKTHLTLDLSSFNIGSSKYFLYLIYHLQDLVEEGFHVNIDWVYEEGDEDMFEVGEDYEAMAGIPFGFKFRTPQIELARSAVLSGS